MANNHFNELFNPQKEAYNDGSLEYAGKPRLSHGKPTLVAEDNPNQDFVPVKKVIPFGMSAVTFGLLIAVLTAVITGAALGGGLGSALAIARSNDRPAPVAKACNISQPSNDSSVAATNLTNWSPPPYSDIFSLNYDCPGLETQTMVNAKGDVFSFKCNIDFWTGKPSKQDPNLVAVDIIRFTAYSLMDCLNACSDYNSNVGNTTCYGVTFKAAVELLADRYKTDPFVPTCWIKNGTTNGLVASSEFMTVSATLLEAAAG